MKFENHSKKLLSKIPKKVIEAAKTNNALLAGGALTSLFTDSKINDYDLYFRNKYDCANFIQGIGSCAVLQLTKKSVTLAIDNCVLQCIWFKYFDSSEDIFNSFDFTINMAAYDFSADEFVIDVRFFTDLAIRKLVINPGTAYPINTLLRVSKYENKGYTIDPVELLKLSVAISKKELKTYGDLRVEISGVYGETYLGIPEDISDHCLDENLNELCELYPDFPSISMDNAILADIVLADNDLAGCKIAGKYLVRFGGIESPSKYGVSHCSIPDMKIIEASEMFPDGRIPIYKSVQFKSLTEYRSYYDNSFVYTPGECVTAKSSSGLFFYLNDSGNFQYSDKGDSIGILAYADIDDIIKLSGDDIVVVKKCKLPVNPILATKQNEWINKAV